MGFYENHILPRFINIACGLKAVQMQRAKVVPRAEGRILEIDFGSGLNMPFYTPEKVDLLLGLEPSEKARKMAQSKIDASGMPFEFVGLDGQEIPLENDSVDTVVLTYTLCTIPDAIKAAGEMHRVLKPGGKLLFSEHGASPDDGVRKWQDRINPAWKKIAGGCHLNRDIPDLLAKGGFHVRQLDSYYIPGPKVAAWTFEGWASKD